MIIAAAPIASLPIATDSVSTAVEPLFSALINNQDADRAYLLDCQPYDPDTASEVDVGFSVGLTRPILNGRAWPARLGTVINTEVRLFDDEIGRGGSASFGVLKVLIGDRDHDEILDYVWDGRSVRVLMGAEGFDYSDFQPVFVGTAQDIEFDERYLAIILRDKSELLNVPIQETLYAGTGALEGGSDLENQPKPLCYGRVQNIQPVLVDRANLIYQWHAGSVASVDGVFDGAKALTFAADVADITATTVTAGQYKTQLSGGYIRLGAEPAKALTLDGHGANASSYVETAADVARRIVTTHTSLTTADINLQSISDTNTANSAAVGWYGNSGTVADVIGQVLESIGGSYTFNRAGELVLGVFAFASPVGTVNAADIISLQRVRTPIPTWRRQIGYGKSWLVQGQNDVVYDATDARKDFVSQEYRYAIDEDSAIKTRRALARVAVVDTLLETGTAAATEATRQQGLFGADRHVYRVVAKRHQFKYRVGQTLTIDYGRFGFPKNAIVLSVVENTDRRYTEFRVFA